MFPVAQKNAKMRTDEDDDDDNGDDESDVDGSENSECLDEDNAKPKKEIQK